jgi:hypothetical protein
MEWSRVRGRGMIRGRLGESFDGLMFRIFWRL